MKSKVIALFLLSLSISFVFAGGTKEKKIVEKLESKASVIKVGALAGPSGVGMAYMFTNTEALDTTKIEYEVLASVDVLLPKLINGDLDIGILPPNVAAKLYNANPNSIVALATVGNSMLTLITKDPSITSLSDLKEKTVSVAGQGSTPDYVFQTLIKANRIAPDSIILDYSIPTTEIAAALIGNKIKYALVPEPFATVAILNSQAENPILRALSIKTLWNEQQFGQDFPMTLCVARKEFATKYPEQLQKFLDAYKYSIEWTVANPKEAGPYVENSGFGLKSAIVTKAIPNSNYVFIPATEAKKDIEKLLETFLEFSPISIGNKLPDNGFYWK